MRYQSSTPKRRFLAGVRCPKCQAMDAVVQVNIVTPVADEYIECTQCGTQSAVQTLMPSVPRTMPKTSSLAMPWRQAPAGQ